MSNEDSVVRWLAAYHEDRAEAARQLWKRFYERMVRLARAKTGAGERRVEDADDVALSAFDSFFRGFEAGRFPELGSEDDLWRLLQVIVSRKVNRLRGRRRAAKRGGGRVRGDSIWQAGADDSLPGDVPVEGRELPAEEGVVVAEECERLLRLLPAPEHREIALMRLEGYGNRDIAQRLDCALRTVERRLEEIRRIWQSALRCDLASARSPRAPAAARASVAPRSPSNTPNDSSVTVPGYEIEEELGRGNAGMVYRARHESSGRKVALKLLAWGSSDDATGHRFAARAGSLTRLRHKRIAECYEVGLWQGHGFLATEYVSAIDFGRALQSRDLAARIKLAAGMVCQVLDALTYGWQRGWLHGRLKPENVLVYSADHRFRTKVTDLGLADCLRECRGSEIVAAEPTRDSLPFLAPEQLMGSGNPTPAADVFAAGALLYMALAGRPPLAFPDDRDPLEVVIADDPPLLASLIAEIPVSLSQLIERSLCKVPEERFASANEMWLALYPFARGNAQG